MPGHVHQIRYRLVSKSEIKKKKRQTNEQISSNTGFGRTHGRTSTRTEKHEFMRPSG